VPSGEATHTNFIVFGVIQPGLEPMTSAVEETTLTTDAVQNTCKPAHAVTIFKQVPVLRGHSFLVLS